MIYTCHRMIIWKRVILSIVRIYSLVVIIILLKKKIKNLIENKLARINLLLATGNSVHIKTIYGKLTILPQYTIMNILNIILVIF